MKLLRALLLLLIFSVAVAANPLFTYSISNDIIAGTVNQQKLTLEIEGDGGIAPNLSYISIIGDSMDVKFDAVLSGPEVLVLDNGTTGPAGGIIGNHDPSDPPPPTVPVGSPEDQFGDQHWSSPFSPVATSDASLGITTTAIWTDTTTLESYIASDASTGVAQWDHITADEADEISYDNGVSGLTAIEVQAAIDELVVDLANSSENDRQTVSAVDSPTTGSLTFVDIPGMTLTTSNSGTLDYLVFFNATVSNSIANRTISIRVIVNGVALPESERDIDLPSSNANTISSTVALKAAVATGQIVKMEWKTSGGTATVNQRTLTFNGAP